MTKGLSEKGDNATFSTIEIHSIDFVPAHERHGTLAGQARFWFLGNFNFATIPIGFIGPSMGLSFWWTFLAETIGILIGTVFQAFHASQGAEMGLPQMIQSRAQFGYRGVIVPLFASFFTFVGFNIVNTILIAQGMFAITGWNQTLTALAASVLGGALAIWGHDWVHKAFTLMFWASVPLFAILTLGVAAGIVISPRHAAGGYNPVGFFTQVAAGASYNITYAVFVSDYTRYLPVLTGRARIIATVFASSSLSAIWLIGLGAWLAIHFGSTDAISDLVTAGNGMFVPFGTVLAVVSIAALIAVIGMNSYSAMLTVLTAIDALHPLRPSRLLRILTTVAVICLSAAAAIGFGGDVIATLNNYFVIMLYLPRALDCGEPDRLFFRSQRQIRARRPFQGRRMLWRLEPHGACSLFCWLCRKRSVLCHARLVHGAGSKSTRRSRHWLVGRIGGDSRALHMADMGTRCNFGNRLCRGERRPYC